MFPGFLGTWSRGGSGSPNHFPPVRFTSLPLLGNVCGSLCPQTKRPRSSPWHLRTSGFILGLTDTAAVPLNYAHSPTSGPLFRLCLECLPPSLSYISSILKSSPNDTSSRKPSLTLPWWDSSNPLQPTFLGLQVAFYLDINHRQPCLLFPHKAGGSWRARLGEDEPNDTQKGQVTEGSAQAKAWQWRISLTSPEGRERA